MECTIRETPENARKRRQQEAQIKAQKEKEKSMAAFRWTLKNEVERLMHKYGIKPVQDAAQSLIDSGYKITSALGYARAIEKRIHTQSA